MSVMSRNIKNALSTDVRTVESDLSMHTAHFLDAHKSTNFGMCERMVKKSVEGTPIQSNSRYVDNSDDKTISLIKEGTVKFLHTYAEEIALWYEGKDVEANIADHNEGKNFVAPREEGKLFAADIDLPDLFGYSCVYNPKQGAFCIKETNRCRVVLKRSNDRLNYTGISCSSVYPVLTDATDKMFYYIPIEDVFKGTKLRDAEKLLFIQKQKHPKLNMYKQVSRTSGNDQFVLTKVLTKSSKITVIFEDGIKEPYVKVRHIDSAKAEFVNIHSEDFSKKFPQNAALLQELSNCWEKIRQDRITELFPERDTAKLNKINNAYSTFCNSQNTDKLKDNTHQNNLTKKPKL